jgi:hypothetical protein
VSEFTDVTEGGPTLQVEPPPAVAVSANCTAVRLAPATVADTVIAPAAAPSVTLTEAAPVESVTALDALRVAEPEVTEKLTVTPATPTLARPLTKIFKAVGSVEPVAPVWLFPAATLRLVGEFRMSF